MRLEQKIRNTEARLRRSLRRHGLVLMKTPSASWLRNWYGAGYMIADDECTVAGYINHPYEMTLADVEAFCEAKAQAC